MSAGKKKICSITLLKKLGDNGIIITKLQEYGGFSYGKNDLVSALPVNNE